MSLKAYSNIDDNELTLQIYYTNSIVSTPNSDIIFSSKTCQIFPYGASTVLFVYYYTNVINLVFYNYSTDSYIINTISLTGSVTSIAFDYCEVSGTKYLIVGIVNNDLILYKIKIDSPSTISSISIILQSSMSTAKIHYIKVAGAWIFLSLSNPDKMLSYLIESMDTSFNTLSGIMVSELIFTNISQVQDIFIYELGYDGEVQFFLFYYLKLGSNNKMRFSKLSNDSNSKCFTLQLSSLSCTMRCPLNTYYNSGGQCLSCSPDKYVNNNSCSTSCSSTSYANPLGACNDSIFIDGRPNYLSSLYYIYSCSSLACTSSKYRLNFADCESCPTTLINDNSNVCVKREVRYINPYTSSIETCIISNSDITYPSYSVITKQCASSCSGLNEENLFNVCSCKNSLQKIYPSTDSCVSACTSRAITITEGIVSECACDSNFYAFNGVDCVSDCPFLFGKESVPTKYCKACSNYKMVSDDICVASCGLTKGQMNSNKYCDYCLISDGVRAYNNDCILASCPNNTYEIRLGSYAYCDSLPIGQVYENYEFKASCNIKGFNTFDDPSVCQYCLNDYYYESNICKVDCSTYYSKNDVDHTCDSCPFSSYAYNQSCVSTCPSITEIHQYDNSTFYCGPCTKLIYLDECISACPTRTISSNGTCQSICSNLQVYNSLTNTCDCNLQNPYLQNSQCVANCSGLHIPDSNNNCVCPIGFELSADNTSCQLICQDLFVLKDQACTCDLTKAYLQKGQCVSECTNGHISDSSRVCICRDGYQFDLTSNQCIQICNAIEVNIENKCICNLAIAYKLNDRCVSNCDSDMLVDSQRNCVCPFGYEYQLSSSTCIQVCDKLQTRINGECICDLNKAFLQNNQCVTACTKEYTSDMNRTCILAIIKRKECELENYTKQKIFGYDVCRLNQNFTTCDNACLYTSVCSTLITKSSESMFCNCDSDYIGIRCQIPQTEMSLIIDTASKAQFYIEKLESDPSSSFSTLVNVTAILMDFPEIQVVNPQILVKFVDLANTYLQYIGTDSYKSLVAIDMSLVMLKNSK